MQCAVFSECKGIVAPSFDVDVYTNFVHEIAFKVGVKCHSFSMYVQTCEQAHYEDKTTRTKAYCGGWLTWNVREGLKEGQARERKR